MIKKTYKVQMMILIFFLSILVDQASAQIEIKKYSLNNGGGKMIGGNYEMQTSIGQVDASQRQIGGVYSVNGGFWQENIDLIFKNGFE